MVHVNNEDRQRALAGEEAARVLARMAGWTTEACGAVLPPVLGGYRYSQPAGIIISHWRRDISFGKLLDAVRQTRADILMLEPGYTNSSRKTYYLSLILARGGEVRIHRGLRLWSADFDSQLWLIADPKDRDLDPCFFSIGPTGVKHQAGAPFGDSVSAETGLRIADLRWLAEINGNFV